MRIITQKLMLMAFAIVVCAPMLGAKTAPPRLIINGPASISGPKQFTYSSDSAFSGPWGRAIDTAYINVPVVKAYDTLGAVSPLLNGTGGYPSLAGKFALILRGGGISFTQKAAYCQAAGAIGVIIVNHKNGGTIGMALTTGFQNITIPVLFISREEGFPVNEAIKANQPVTITLTPWGLNKTNDVGFLNYTATLPHAFCIPANQVAGAIPRAYNFYNGALVCNFGSADQANVKLKQTLTYTPTGGSGSVVYSDSAVIPQFAVADSIRSVISSRSTRQGFAGTGTVDMNYTLSATAADENLSDNTASYRMYLTDSIFCKSHWDPEKGAPVVSSSIRSRATTAAPAPPIVAGPLFYVNKGGYKAAKAQFSIVTDSDLINKNTSIPSVLVYLYKWTDANKDGLVNGPELSIVAAASKTLFSATDSAGKPFTVDLVNPKSNRLIARVQDSSWYFLAVQSDFTVRLGTDNTADPYTRIISSFHADSAGGTKPELPAAATAMNAGLQPNYTIAADTLPISPFYDNNKNIVNPDTAVFAQTLNGTLPAMALHLSRQIPTAVQENTGYSLFNDFSVYPNPVSGQLNISLTLDKPSTIMVSVVSATGQALSFQRFTQFNGGKIIVPTSNIPSGNYFIVVGADAGTEMRPFTVLH